MSKVAGVVVALVTSPVDLAKTRIMSHTGDGGVLGTMLSVVKHEGFVMFRFASPFVISITQNVLLTRPLALYKGFHAQWLRIGYVEW